MADSLITAFHHHLHACRMAPATQERSVSCILRLVAFASVPAAELASQQTYDHLLDQSNRLGLSASWYTSNSWPSSGGSNSGNRPWN
jgi:hypothetical protein